MRTRPATAIGEAAAHILSGTREGRVAAVFERSFYAAFAGGLVCIGSAEFSVGPSSLLAVFDDIGAWRDRLVQGDPVAVRDGAVFAGGVAVDFSGLTPWRAPPVPPLRAIDIAGGLGQIAEAVERREAVGLGVLVGALCHGRSLAPSGIDPFLKRSIPVIAALGDWVERAMEGEAGPVPDPTPLIGLGPGLTPSGDDFISGFLVALRRLGRGAVADALAAVVLPIAERATNTISAAHLTHAASGQISACLIEVFDRVVAGDGCEALLDQVSSIGHTSGWDCLAGLIAAASAIERGRRVREAL